MNLKKTREKYKSFKNIINIIESGNIKDPRYKLIIEGLTIEDVDNMKRFIYECENYGIQYLTQSN
jgi:hypothetical protein